MSSELPPCPALSPALGPSLSCPFHCLTCPLPVLTCGIKENGPVADLGQTTLRGAANQGLHSWIIGRLRSMSIKTIVYGFTRGIAKAGGETCCIHPRTCRSTHFCHPSALVPTRLTKRATGFHDGVKPVAEVLRGQSEATWRYNHQSSSFTPPQFRVQLPVCDPLSTRMTCDFDRFASCPVATQ